MFDLNKTNTFVAQCDRKMNEYNLKVEELNRKIQKVDSKFEQIVVLKENI